MTPRLVAAMRDHFARFRFSGLLWVFDHTTKCRHYKARIHSLRASFKNAVRRAKLPAAFHAHDLRRRRVTTWLVECANPVHVREAMGHSDLRTTMVYTHLAREHLRSLVQAPAQAGTEPTEAAS
jgi:site-specific recombinase XerD